MVRAVITGMGIVSPIGQDVESFWQAVKTGQNGVGPIKRFDTTHFAYKQAAEVRNLETRLKDRADLAGQDRQTQLALLAAQEAVETSQLDLSTVSPYRIGVAFGTSNGHNDTFVEYWESEKTQQAQGFDVLKGLIFNVTGLVTKQLGAQGPTATFVTACAAGTNAIGYALDQIQSGTCDVVLAGGGDILSPIVFGGFCTLGALAKESSRPFSSDRDGVSLGEGAAWLLVEEYEHAVRRNATIYAEVHSYALSNDAYHVTAPDPEGKGAVKTMRGALQAAGLQPSEIDYVNAHGTATDANDSMETKAILEVFKDRLPAVSSSKSQFGHALGGAGALEAVATVLALHHQFLPPTLGCLNPMSDQFDFVTAKGRPAVLKKAISNSFAFGGNTATLALGAVQK